MTRREYYYGPQCVHEGCTERAHYVFDRRADEVAEIRRLERSGGWRCVRHTRPDEVLSVETPFRETVLVSYEESYGKFWAPEGERKSGGGFKYGPGFKAYADDFPAGTRLVITARIEAPCR